MADVPAQTLEKIAHVMRRTFRLRDGYEVDPSTTSADVDGWDSLSHAMFIMELEREFNVEIPLEKAYSLANVGEMAQLLNGLSGGKHP